jgi:hypothetical protein
MHRRTILRTHCALAIASILLAARYAHATVQFQKAFVREYIVDHSDRDFAAFAQRKARCNICHQGCKDRTQHNRYGTELAKLLDHRADKNDVAKIVAALTTVGEMPADPSQPAGETFGERIKNSMLPAGELDMLRLEPAD